MAQGGAQWYAATVRHVLLRTAKLSVMGARQIGSAPSPASFSRLGSDSGRTRVTYPARAVRVDSPGGWAR